MLAFESLGSIDPTGADADVLAQLVEGVEQARRMIDAAATGVAGVIDARNPFRTSHGYLNARTFLTQRAQLSGPEAYRRLQTARMRTRLPEWATAAHTGTVGIAQSDAMARVAANTRNERATARRDVNLHPRPDGGWNITGHLPNCWASNSPRSSHGSSTPNGEATGPTPANGSAPTQTSPTSSAPKHNDAPTP